MGTYTPTQWYVECWNAGGTRLRYESFIKSTTFRNQAGELDAWWFLQSETYHPESQYYTQKKGNWRVRALVFDEGFERSGWTAELESLGSGYFSHLNRLA